MANDKNKKPILIKNTRARTKLIIEKDQLILFAGPNVRIFMSTIY
jgi:hypothetical protein